MSFLSFLLKLHHVHIFWYSIKFLKIQGIELFFVYLQNTGYSAFFEIASAIDNHQIVCFVCHFDLDYQGQKDDKYSIVKVYTTEELVEIIPAIAYEAAFDAIGEPVPTAPTITEKLASTIDRVDLTAQSTSTDQPTTKGQFFSPTKKMVLDSIGRKSNIADKPTSSNVAAKRSLTFEAAIPRTNALSIEKTTIDTIPLVAAKNGIKDNKLDSPKSAHMTLLKTPRESAM